MNNILNCQDGCTTVGSQKAKICLPVSIVPYAVTSPAIVNCCGKTGISCGCDCQSGTQETSCEFIISQVINVDVPVEFGASVKIGETYIECGVSSLEEESDYVYVSTEEMIEDEFQDLESEEKNEYNSSDYDQNEEDPYLGA